MAPSDDLKSHAASSQDFYALLDISPAAADTEIRRAYRRTALKYHPDKLSNPTPADLEKFHLLQIAYDVLSEPSVRQLYDNAREARERKKRESEMLEGVRRKMKDDLEARERGVKRSWGPGESEAAATVDREAEDKLEREIRRLAEEGKRRRRAKEEMMRKEVLEEEERQEREKEEKECTGQTQSQGPPDRANNGTGGTTVAEIDRTIKVRWVREGPGLDLDKTHIESLFSKFGKVESVFTLKDKRQRVGEHREKRIVATGVVLFSSIVGAHAAVEDRAKQHGAEWDTIESVYWASNKEPDWESHRPSSAAAAQGSRQSNSPVAPAASEPPTPRPAAKPRDQESFPGLGSQIPSSNNGKETKKAPSFASFGKGQPSTGTASNSPSLEEITMIRLKNAERKKLEEQIQREDEAALAGETVQ